MGKNVRLGLSTIQDHESRITALEKATTVIHKVTPVSPLKTATVAIEENKAKEHEKIAALDASLSGKVDMNKAVEAATKKKSKKKSKKKR